MFADAPGARVAAGRDVPGAEEVVAAAEGDQPDPDGERPGFLAGQQCPGSMHRSVMAHHAPVVDEFLADLELAVETAKASDTEEATAPLYGLSGTLEQSDDVTETLVDVLNEVFV